MSSCIGCAILTVLFLFQPIKSEVLTLCSTGPGTTATHNLTSVSSSAVVECFCLRECTFYGAPGTHTMITNFTARSPIVRFEFLELKVAENFQIKASQATEFYFMNSSLMVPKDATMSVFSETRFVCEKCGQAKASITLENNSTFNLNSTVTMDGMRLIQETEVTLNDPSGMHLVNSELHLHQPLVVNSIPGIDAVILEGSSMTGNGRMEISKGNVDFTNATIGVLIQAGDPIQNTSSSSPSSSPSPSPADTMGGGTPITVYLCASAMDLSTLHIGEGAILQVDLRCQMDMQVESASTSISQGANNVSIGGTIDFMGLGENAEPLFVDGSVTINDRAHITIEYADPQVSLKNLKESMLALFDAAKYKFSRWNGTELILARWTEGSCQNLSSSVSVACPERTQCTLSIQNTSNECHLMYHQKEIPLFQKADALNEWVFIGVGIALASLLVIACVGISFYFACRSHKKSHRKDRKDTNQGIRSNEMSPIHLDIPSAGPSGIGPQSLKSLPGPGPSTQAPLSPNWNWKAI